MNHLPRISVILPSFNHGRFIERALCSVLDQGYENLETIVVDGESWDETRDVLPLYTDRIDTLIVEQDSGPAQAINKGLAVATGDIIAIVNCDDILLPGALQAAAQRMTGDNACCWLVGYCVRVNEPGDPIGTIDAAAPDCTASFLMHDSGILPTSSSFYHRELFARLGHLDESLEHAYLYEFACRALIGTVQPTIFASALAERREHSENRTTNHAIERGLEMIDAAGKLASSLPLQQRAALVDNLDIRMRILIAAQRENTTASVRAQRMIVEQLVNRQQTRRRAA